MNSFMLVILLFLEGIYVYLFFGMIYGIGEKMVKRIIDKFGVDMLEVI